MDGMSTTAKSAAGAVCLVLLLALGYLGAQYALGAYDDDYRVNVVLGELWQGVVKGTDVKIRGVNVGEVGSITLTDDLRAVAELVLEPDLAIPERATFAATGKTLLGEKQIEIDFDGAVDEGPFIAQGGTVDDATRVVELQDVLGELTELFEALDPDDLAVVINDGIGAFDGQGQAIARSIDQGKRATEVFSRSLDDQEAGIRDLSLVAEALGPTGAEFNRLGRELIVGLPTITDNQVALRSLLLDLQRFAGVLDATLVVDRARLDRLIVEGDSVTRMLFAYRPEVGELLTGLADYTEKFNQEGFTSPGTTGQGAAFALIVPAFDEEICRSLPPELTSPLPVCGGDGGRLPVPELPLDLGLPILPNPGDGVPLLQLPTQGMLRPEVPTRHGVDELLRSVLSTTQAGAGR
jgi:phospholipid/cholesterol/gamma-HCH transport system substrate-binding protein